MNNDLVPYNSDDALSALGKAAGSQRTACVDIDTLREAFSRLPDAERCEGNVREIIVELQKPLGYSNGVMELERIASIKLCFVKFKEDVYRVDATHYTKTTWVFEGQVKSFR